ncbi:hypothetical protein KJ359_001908 [Pestalotiopsis sp. 9143b]|nr:hypothetical protein KJ359_001908 [Pestalotiopsis sp. 9143b]
MDEAIAVEERALPSTSSDTLSSLRSLSIQCRELLHKLHFEDDKAHHAFTNSGHILTESEPVASITSPPPNKLDQAPSGRIPVRVTRDVGGDGLGDDSVNLQALELPEQVDAEEMTASFNIFMANLGVFREGQQSLEVRLKSVPQLSNLTQRLLLALKRDLGDLVKMRQLSAVSGFSGNVAEARTSGSDTDDSSDRSTTYRLRLPFPDHEDLPALEIRPSLVTRIQDTIVNLSQVASTIHLMGTQHRHERMERFKNLEHNKQTYQLFYNVAYQSISHTFPNASVALQKRIAESIATRRMRFLYLKRHQVKISKFTDLDPMPRKIGVYEPADGAPLDQEEEAVPSKSQQAKPQPSVQYSIPAGTIVSKTTDTKLNPTGGKAKRADSVASIKLAAGKFPSRPKVDDSGIFFTCPYCFLVLEAKDFSEEDQWL